MEKTIITHGRCFLPDGIRETALVLEDGHLAAVLPEEELPGETDARVIDAEGLYVSPGFVDLHVHGGGGCDFLDGTAEAFHRIAQLHAAHGTTALLPTSATCSWKELQRFFATYHKARSIPSKGAAFLGIHAEGPFFAPEYAGAQDPSFLQIPTQENVRELLDSSPDIVRISAAPELEGALELGRECRRRGILASIGHTAATTAQCEAAAQAGYSLMTHFYCAMSSVVRRSAFRTGGAVEAGYLLDGMDVEVIADGCHLPEELLRLVFKVKGPDHIALCTDAMRGAGMPEGEYRLGSQDGGQTVIVEDGVAKLPDRSAFAGSVATADRLVRTMAAVRGVGLENAVRMMTSTPARILGLEGRKGAIIPGADADLVLFDAGVRVRRTLVAGKTVYDSEKPNA